MNIKLYWKESFTLVKKCNLLTFRSALLIIVYYATSIFGVLLDGAGLVMFVDFITGKAEAISQSSMLKYVIAVLNFFSINTSVSVLYYVIVVLFLFRFFMIFGASIVDGYLEANIRRRIQENGFNAIMCGDWEYLRNMRVGERVGAITEEAVYVTKYLMALIKILIYVGTSFVLMLMAMMVSLEITMVLILLGLPSIIFLKILFDKQGEIIEKLVAERQRFYAYITESLNGLFQIKVGGESESYILRGAGIQYNLFKTEMKYNLSRAFILGLNVLFPVIALITFYCWFVLWKGDSLNNTISLFAAVGIVGARALSQVNVLVSSVGELTGFAGSLFPVHKLFVVPEEIKKKDISEKINRVILKNISYLYENSNGIANVTLGAGINNPLIIKGPSGSGKTTIANLIAGIYKQSSGDIYYIDNSERIYDASLYRPKIGYVTQDIQLFYGTIRDNLNSSLAAISDKKMWECLDKTGSRKFVESMGGLEAEIVEAGRSLSGGEKRRLGIARVLTKDPDILIFDEVTVGLDEEKKIELTETIKNLAKYLVVIIISHENIDIDTENILILNKEEQKEPFIIES